MVFTLSELEPIEGFEESIVTERIQTDEGLGVEIILRL